MRSLLGTGSISYSRKALFASLGAIAALCVYRAYDLWLTGFIVSDEHGYISQAMSNSIAGAVYTDRYFFGYFNYLLFHLLGVANIDSFVVLLPFYLFFWAAATLIAFYLIMKTLKFDAKIIAYSLFSAFFLVGFVLLSLGFLTEPVGLALAMWGALFMVKFAKFDGTGFRVVLYALLSSLFFAAARYTREPYGALLVGCIPVVLLLGLYRMRGATARRRLILAVSILLFIGPSLYFSYYPSSILTLGSQPVSQFVGTISFPIVSQNQTQTTTTTITSIVSSAMTRTTLKVVTSVTNSTTFTTTETQTIVSTTTTQVTTTAINTLTSSSFILNNKLVNTVWIFFAGIALSWDPILLAIGGVSFFLFLPKLRKIDVTHATIIALVLLSLGSYLVVSYILSPDPSYLTLQHYSTILRFSDTSLPAYFLLAPFAYSAIARRPRYLVLLGAGLVVFTLLSIPAYEAYASSNLDLPANPFALSYRTPEVMIRNYISSHQSDAPFYIMGLSNATFADWWFTPGNTYLKGVHLYPYLNQSSFVNRRWTVFYVVGSSTSQLSGSLPYIFGNSSSSAVEKGMLPFTMVRSTPIFQSSGFLFEKIQLDWGSSQPSL